MRRLNSFKQLTDSQLDALDDAVQSERLFRRYQTKRKAFEASGGFASLAKNSVLNHLTADEINDILRD